MSMSQNADLAIGGTQIVDEDDSFEDVAYTVWDVSLPGWPIEYASAQYEHLTGFSHPVTVGHAFRSVALSSADVAALYTVRTSISLGQPCRVCVRHAHATLGWIEADLDLTPVPTESGPPVRYLAIHSDASWRREALDQLKAGLASRSKTGEHEQGRAKR